jgi:prolipoprotein diacylglyceryltransferase
MASGEAIAIVLIVALFLGSRLYSVGLTAVAGFSLWASFETGRRIVEAGIASSGSALAALLVLVVLAWVFPGVDSRHRGETDGSDRVAAASLEAAQLTLLMITAGLLLGLTAATVTRLIGA